MGHHPDCPGAHRYGQHTLSLQPGQEIPGFDPVSQSKNHNVGINRIDLSDKREWSKKLTDYFCPLMVGCQTVYMMVEGVNPGSGKVS